VCLNFAGPVPLLVSATSGGAASAAVVLEHALCRKSYYCNGFAGLATSAKFRKKFRCIRQPRNTSNVRGNTFTAILKFVTCEEIAENNVSKKAEHNWKEEES